MLEVKLTYSIDETLEEIALDGGKMSFGRGDEADLRLDDDGLSRLHAVIYREDEQIWIVDENSTNGTFVNGERVSSSGTALFDGDIIKIGNYTKLKITISEAQEEKKEEEKEEKATAAVSADAPVKTDVKADAAKSSFGMIPLLITGLAVFVIAASAIFIGVKVFGSSDSDIVYETNTDFETIEEETGETGETPVPKRTPSGQTSSPTPLNNGGSTTSSPTNTPMPQLPDNPNANKVLVTETKKYQQLNDTEKKSYISVKAEQIAQIIGNQKSEAIPAKAIDSIKYYVDGYASRLNQAKRDDCNQGTWGKSDFRSVLERASKTSQFVVRSFNVENLEPQIGIYVAMIESEHCSCLTSKTGAVGMFQFLASTSPDYGLAADKRCEPELSAKAAANYLKSLIGFFGSAPDSVPLAIASFNSGQGNLRNNMGKVFTAEGGKDRSFWTLVENKGLMEGKAGKQFDDENENYVPKFFATAIIGENPQDFGVTQKPLSLNR